MMNTFIGLSLLLIKDVAAQVPQKDFLVPPVPMDDASHKLKQEANADLSNGGARPLAGLSEQTKANAEEGQQDGTTVTDGEKTTTTTGAPTTAAAAGAPTTAAAAGANISTLFPTTTLAPNTAQATKSTTEEDDDDSGLSFDFLLKLASEEGANFLLGFMESTLGNEAKRLLPKLKPLLPRLQKIVEDIVAGDKTPDFSVLKELPAGIIRKLVPALVRGLKDSPLALAIPEEVFDLFAHDSNLLPHLLESIPEVAPLFFKFYKDGDLGALMDSLLELVQDPKFIKDAANILPQILSVTSLGDVVPPEVMELWPDFTKTLTDAIPMLLREVPQVQDAAKDGVRITEKLIKMVRPLYRRVVKLTGMEDNQALVDTTELIDAVAPIAKDLILANSKQDLRTLVLKNMGRMIRIPTLFKRALSSIMALSEDDGSVDADGDEEDDKEEEEDYLKCANKCKEKVPKSAFDCEKSPLVVVRCLAVCEDKDNYITEPIIKDLKLFEQYRYCDALSFMFFESPSRVCKPDIDSVHCKKYLANMPEKYFELTTGQNFDDQLDEVHDSLLTDAKEGSNAGTTLTSGALMLPLFLF